MGLLTLNAPPGILLPANEDIDLKEGGPSPGCGCILFDLKLSLAPVAPRLGCRPMDAACGCSCCCGDWPGLAVNLSIKLPAIAGEAAAEEGVGA